MRKNIAVIFFKIILCKILSKLKQSLELTKFYLLLNFSGIKVFVGDKVFAEYPDGRIQEINKRA